MCVLPISFDFFNFVGCVFYQFRFIFSISLDVCFTNFVCFCLSVALVVEQFRFSL